jgi:hypothetical protein
VFERLFPAMKIQDRETILVIMGWYAVDGMCQENSLPANFVDFPRMCALLSDIEKEIQENEKGVEEHRVLS